MIKKKTMYEASDGTLLPSRDAAQTYEDMVELYEYVDENNIYCTHNHGNIGADDLRLWLAGNPRIFIKLLPKEDDDPTPYCAGCGAMTVHHCDCGPIAENN
jgi:hypothetical protein